MSFLCISQNYTINIRYNDYMDNELELVSVNGKSSEHELTTMNKSITYPSSICYILLPIYKTSLNTTIFLVETHHIIKLEKHNESKT